MALQGEVLKNQYCRLVSALCRQRAECHGSEEGPACLLLARRCAAESWLQWLSVNRPEASKVRLALVDITACSLTCLGFK